MIKPFDEMTPEAIYLLVQAQWNEATELARELFLEPLLDKEEQHWTTWVRGWGFQEILVYRPRPEWMK